MVIWTKATYNVVSSLQFELVQEDLQSMGNEATIDIVGKGALDIRDAMGKIPLKIVV